MSAGELYVAGIKMGQEDVVNIALHYLTFKIQDLALESLFLALPLHHVRKVLASSRLNVPDELSVGKMALKWMEAQQKVRLSRTFFWNETDVQRCSLGWTVMMFSGM